MKQFRRLRAKWLVWRGKAVDIWSKSPYPANVLSNLHDNAFMFDGVECGSMEGFLQSLKYQDHEEQRRICAMSGIEAKHMTKSDWQEAQTVWWRGRAVHRQDSEFLYLVRQAYDAMLSQNNTFREALMSTKGRTLLHSNGENDPKKTILTETEFCSILTDIRDEQAMIDFKKSHNITPSFVSSLKKDEIFVFGCRRSGRHMEGAAYFALNNFGAVYGQGEGRQGQSYAIATAGVGLSHINDEVMRFTEYASMHPELHFLVTAVGCGLGCWNVNQIAPMFRKAASLRNVWLPQEFWDELKTE